MKNIIEHHIKNNRDYIVRNSLIHAHFDHLYSIALAEHNGRMTRIYVNYPASFVSQDEIDFENLPVAVHSHHCDLIIDQLSGKTLHIFAHELIKAGGIEYKKWAYTSAIRNGSNGKGRFEYISKKKLIFEPPYECRKNLFLNASWMHSVTCTPYDVSAWMITEGIEDMNYKNIAYSNKDLSGPIAVHQNQRFDDFEQIFEVLKDAKLV